MCQCGVVFGALILFYKWLINDFGYVQCWPTKRLAEIEIRYCLKLISPVATLHEKQHMNQHPSETTQQNKPANRRRRRRRRRCVSNITNKLGVTHAKRSDRSKHRERQYL
jgi:hypothetical protein